jgi:membrane-associated phospholipid phosphatase
MTGFMHVMSFIGSAGCYVPALAVVFWCVNPRAGAGAAVVLTMSGALNVLLKLEIHAPRPYWTDPAIIGHEPLATFGMPSGHAQSAAVAYGLLGLFGARVARGLGGRVAIWAGVGAVVGLVGVSRVYLGVHSAGQVLAGWLIGAALLVTVRVFGPVVVAWWRRRRPEVQLVLSLAGSLAFLVPTAVAVAGLRSWRWPATWARAIETAGGSVGQITLVDGAAVAGTLFCVLAGVSWLARRGWFDPGGTPWRRIARVPIGAGGAGVILLCGWLAGDTSAGVFAIFVTFAGCAAAGAWLTAGAPEVFVLLGLATRDRAPSARHSQGTLSAGHF